MSVGYKKLNTPSIKVVATRDCIIGHRVCEQGHVIKVNEVVAYRAVGGSQPRAELAPEEFFKTSFDKLSAEAIYDDAEETYGGDSEFLGDVEDLYESEKDAAAARANASIGVRGPAVKVTAARDGRIAGVRVKAGETVEVAEADAVDAMRDGSARRNSTVLTRAGVRYLNGVTGEYTPPAPGAREIPKIKFVATRDHVMIGKRVAMSGEVVELPEDVAHVILRPIPDLPDGVFDNKNRDRGFRLAPGARFTMSQNQLEEAAKYLQSNGGVDSVS